MIGVPTLAGIVLDREKLAGLPFEALWALFLQAGQLQTEIAGAMIPAAGRAVAAGATEDDRLLTIPEAATILQIHPATMKRMLRELPYNAAAVVLSPRCVRVSQQRLEQILLGGGLRARRKAVSA